MFKNFSNIFFQLAKKKRIIYFLSVLTLSILEFLGLGLFLPVILSILDNSLLTSIIEKYDFNYLIKLNYEETITFFLFLLLGFYFIKSLISTFLKKKVLDTLAEFELHLSKKLFNNYVKKDLRFHITNNSAELIRDIQMISTIKGVLKEYFTIFTEFLLLLAIVTTLFFFYSADILIVFAFILFFYLMFFIIPKKKLENIGYSRMVADGKSVKDLKDSFFAIKLLRLHNIEDFFVEKFAKSKKIAAYTDAKRQFINILPGIWIEMVFILSVIIIILFTMNYNILNQKELVIKLGIFSVIFFRTLPSLSRIIASLQFIKYAQKFVDRYSQIKSHSEQNDLSQKKVIDIKKKPNFDFDQILIQNLNFNHKDSKVNLLKNVNIEISKGQLIEIVGESGSGKSTLLNLILGLLKPIDGRIYFKNQKISSTDSNWKNHFSFVPQESIIIDETIANNIAIGVIDIKKDNSKLSYSMTASGLNKFLDKSLNYSLGEGGSRLSGGENQRIGISRAIYRDTPVIVMDEPTASLDQKNQDKIVETINHIKNNQKKTIIIVSHKKLNGLQIDKTYNISNGIVSELKTNLK